MNIIIYKSEIEEALKRESSLVSKMPLSDKGGTIHDILYIDENEFKVLEGAYQDAVSVITSALREFLSFDPEVTEASVVYSLRKSYPEMGKAIKSDIVGYIVKAIMAQWVAVVLPAQKPQYEQSALTTLNNLNTKLYYKAPPLR